MVTHSVTVVEPTFGPLVLTTGGGGAGQRSKSELTSQQTTATVAGEGVKDAVGRHRQQKTRRTKEAAADLEGGKRQKM